MNEMLTTLALVAAGLATVDADADKSAGPGQPERPRVRQMDQPAEKPADAGRPAVVPRPASLGVVTGPVTAELREHANLPERGGLVITRVEPGSPAAKGGLKPNDILLAFDGVDVTSPLDLAEMVDGAGPGTQVTLGIVRRGTPQRIEVVLAPRKPGMDGRPRAANGGRPPIPGMPPQAGDLLAQAMAMAQAGDGGGSSVQVQTSTVNGVVESRAVSRDERGTVEIVAREGRTTVSIVGPDGGEIHAGSLESPDDLEAVPEEWRERVERLEERTAGRPPPLGGI